MKVKCFVVALLTLQKSSCSCVSSCLNHKKKQTFMCFISPTDKHSENDWNTAVLTQPTHILAIDSVVALVTFAKHLCIIHGLSTKVASDKSYHACPVSSSLRLTTFYITKGVLNIVCWRRQTGLYKTEINRVVNRPNNQSSAKKQANRERERMCAVNNSKTLVRCYRKMLTKVLDRFSVCCWCIKYYSAFHYLLIICFESFFTLRSTDNVSQCFWHLKH